MGVGRTRGVGTQSGPVCHRCTSIGSCTKTASDEAITLQWLLEPFSMQSVRAQPHSHHLRTDATGPTSFCRVVLPSNSPSPSQRNNGKSGLREKQGIKSSLTAPSRELHCRTISCLSPEAEIIRFRRSCSAHEYLCSQVRIHLSPWGRFNSKQRVKTCDV